MSPIKSKALKPIQALKRIAPIAARPVAAAPVVEAAEMVSVRMPASSLDALFRMLPVKAKVAAVEQLLAGVAGA